MSSKNLSANFKKSQGERLSNVIKELGLKKKQFAESIKLGQSLISEICGGKKSLQDYQLLLIEKVHGVNPEYLTAKSDEMFIPEIKQKTSLKKEEESALIPVLENQIEELKEDKKDLKERCKGLEAEKKILVDRVGQLTDEFFQEKARLQEQIDELKKELNALSEGKKPA